MSSRSALTTLRRRALGLALLLGIMLFFVLTIAIYQKAFSSTVDVKLRAASTGNQLKPESDVKVRGMVVGRVEEIRARGDGAELDLALDPGKAGRLPANVSARLLPRTLFGERYVSLELPSKPSAASLASGDVIGQDRTRASIELEKVLSDTMPVLQAVHPDELATTLNALSHALEGRGKPLGETISQLKTHLDGLNPSVPDLQQNLRQLVGVAETYEKAAPDVLAAMEHLSTTSRTMVEQRKNLDNLTKQLTTTSGDTTQFLEANQNNLIRLGEFQRPTLDVMAKYSPAYPCFLRELANYVPRVNEVFGVGNNEPGLHISLEVVPHRGKYVPGQDEPEYADKRGSRCYELANPPERFPQYPPDGPIKDGSTAPPAARSSDSGAFFPSAQESTDGPAGTSPQAAGTSPQATGTSPQFVGGNLGMENSSAERDFVSALLAPSMGISATEVPDWNSLLVGPALRGAEVSYR